MRLSYLVFALGAAALLIFVQFPGGELHGSVAPPELPYYFGTDTSVKPLVFPRGEEQGYDFYAGRLGKDDLKCRIQNNAGWDILYLPDHVPVPPGEGCPFQFEAVEDMIAKLNPQAARQRTYAYWWLFGPKFESQSPRQWGAKQARLLFQQVRKYRKWIGGRVLFADIEPPLLDPENDSWETCAIGGVVVDPEGCEKNRTVLNGFMEYVARVKAQAKEFGVRAYEFEPGVYTTPELWIQYFGVDYVPEVTVRGPRARSMVQPQPQKQPFVLWVTGCATSAGTYDPAEADDIQNRDLMSIVHQTMLGGSKAVWWQYHIEKPDFDVTQQNPAGGLTPVPSAITYHCSCDDPALSRPGAFGTCPPVSNAALETLTIPSDGSLVTTGGSYPSSKTFRIEVSGTYRWGLCDPFNCPNGGACNYERYGDAEYLTDDCWATQDEQFFAWDISVIVDGEYVDWGPFTPDHAYSLEFDGRDAPFSFQIADCPNCYGDNEGSLSVTIYDISP